jgi:hypothetical protein
MLSWYDCTYLNWVLILLSRLTQYGIIAPPPHSLLRWNNRAPWRDLKWTGILLLLAIGRYIHFTPWFHLKPIMLQYCYDLILLFFLRLSLSMWTDTNTGFPSNCLVALVYIGVSSLEKKQLHLINFTTTWIKKYQSRCLFLCEIITK